MFLLILITKVLFFRKDRKWLDLHGLLLDFSLLYMLMDFIEIVVHKVEIVVQMDKEVLKDQ